MGGTSGGVNASAASLPTWSGRRTPDGFGMLEKIGASIRYGKYLTFLTMRWRDCPVPNCHWVCPLYRVTWCGIKVTAWYGSDIKKRNNAMNYMIFRFSILQYCAVLFCLIFKSLQITKVHDIPEPILIILVICILSQILVGITAFWRNIVKDQYLCFFLKLGKFLGIPQIVQCQIMLNVHHVLF